MKKIVLFMLVFTLFIVMNTVPTYALSSNESIAEYADKKIVFLGDSITDGTYVLLEENRFSDIVAAELNFDDMVNMGVAGSNVSDDVAGRDDSLLERAPSVPVDVDYIVVMAGVNDSANDVTIANFSADLDALIDILLAKNSDVEVIFLSPWAWNPDAGAVNGLGLPFSDYQTAVRDAVDTGDSHRLSYVPAEAYGWTSTSTSERDDYTSGSNGSPDGLHLNIAGNRWFADFLISYFAGENLFNGLEMHDGGYTQSGSINEAGTTAYSDFIPVEAGKSYLWSANGTNGNSVSIIGSFFDADKEYISNIPGYMSANVTVTAPENAEYVIMNSGVLTDYSNVFFRELDNYITYTVTYDYNSIMEDSTEVLEVGEKATMPTEPTKQGYTFVAWYKDEALTQIYDFDDIVTESITLYAKWTSPTTGIITSPGGTTTILGLEWYYVLAIAGGIYFVLGTKKGRKAVGLK